MALCGSGHLVFIYRGERLFEVGQCAGRHLSVQMSHFTRAFAHLAASVRDLCKSLAHFERHRGMVPETHQTHRSRPDVPNAQLYLALRLLHRQIHARLRTQHPLGCRAQNERPFALLVSELPTLRKGAPKQGLRHLFEAFRRAVRIFVPFVVDRGTSV